MQSNTSPIDIPACDAMSLELISRRAALDSLESTFQRDIRPLLDVVDKIRAQGVTEENIQLPTIVVVGDQSSGKSSVLESLAGITLPRGQGIATRVPLVLRLQSCQLEESIIKMDYGNVKDQEISGEEQIEAAINAATNALAGSGKGVKDSPIQLLIRKPNSPDLTMVDLPGITRVPVHGQPKNIYEQIRGMIMRYITPEESIILNVLSAQVDFPTCESIRMSQQVDKEGNRTLAVVTKVDKAPEGLLEKVTTDAVNIGLGYICVRNRIDVDDSIAIARQRERELFESHPALKELDGSMVGIPALARKLTKIQSDMVKECLPRIQKQMFEALHKRNQQLSNLPRGIKSDMDARSAFFQVQNKILTILSQVVRDGNFEEFPSDAHLHYTARLHQKFQTFADDLHKTGLKFREQSQTTEIRELLVEHQGVGLPDFLPHSVLHHLMRKQITSVNETCRSLVDEAFEYATEVVLRVNSLCSQGYPRLEKSYKQLAIETLEEVKTTTMEFVERMLEKESTIIFTTNDYYTATLEKMQTALGEAKRTSTYSSRAVELGPGEDKIALVEILNDPDRKYQDAWRLKVSVAAYWKVVQKRLADEIPLEIRYALQCAVVDTLHQNMMSKPWAGGETDLRALMEEDSVGAYTRSRLQLRVDALKDCLRLLSGLMC
ncbi:hypothetical protein KC19_9G097200 [Ceratodon purpureus]|uniref:Uncharacterized protein n=1 Tax=Ceratodon purpureus TaxID=3225 RepID=A0A8T0GTG6_CERPU|nr:hypothetical protein KC19_9G097200 [Ceratodon purpureus]